MCFEPEITVEQSRFGFGKKYEKARDEARGGKPYDKRRLDPSGPVNRFTISLTPKETNMIPIGLNRSKWIRGAIQSSATPPLTRTNYNRNSFQNQALSIIINPSLNPNQKTSCITSLTEAFIVLDPT
jgi:hypothetical protein